MRILAHSLKNIWACLSLTKRALRGCSPVHLVLAAIAFWCLGTCAAESGETAPAKIGLRVIYFGHLQSPRAKDFVQFLGGHFAKVEQGDLDTFREAEAATYDVTILDYGELKIVDNRIQLPPNPVSRQYSHPTVTIGATGALICNRMGLKTGYL
jgi:hypothetical protein